MRQLPSGTRAIPGGGLYPIATEAWSTPWTLSAVPEDGMGWDGEFSLYNAEEAHRPHAPGRLYFSRVQP